MNYIEQKQAYVEYVCLLSHSQRAAGYYVKNKKGVIRKSHNKPAELIGGGTTDKDFFYTSFEHVDCAMAIATIVNELYVLSTWQDTIAPKYHEYFNKDFRVP